MHIGITGGSGFVGRHLSRALLAAGHSVTVFSRSAPAKPAQGVHFARWNPEAGEYNAADFAPLEAVVHLAGAGVADKRWTPARKAEIVRSRVQGTRTLVEALRTSAPECRTLVAASAIGWYGPDRGDVTPFTEDAPAYEDFLGNTCAQWEEASGWANQFLRTVILRLGIVLGRDGGAWPQLTKGLRLAGVKTILGTGRQVVSWVHVDDIVGAILHALSTQTVQGVYNTVAPHPVTHRALMDALAAAKGGLAIPVPIPTAALKLAMGEMSIEVLKSCTVSARKLVMAGYAFRFPGIADAARDLAHARPAAT